jgi:hypothetical protein
MLYSALEGKFYAEMAGVGPATELAIWQFGAKPIIVQKGSKKKLFKLAEKLTPGRFKPKHRIMVEGLPEFRKAIQYVAAVQPSPASGKATVQPIKAA